MFHVKHNCLLQKKQKESICLDSFFINYCFIIIIKFDENVVFLLGLFFLFYVSRETLEGFVIVI
jgi:hypothetical protein